MPAGSAAPPGADWHQAHLVGGYAKPLLGLCGVTRLSPRFLPVPGHEHRAVFIRRRGADIAVPPEELEDACLPVKPLQPLAKCAQLEVLEEKVQELAREPPRHALGRQATAEKALFSIRETLQQISENHMRDV